jgi:polygalacturonase
MHEELKNIILSNIKIPTFQRHVELSLLDFGAVGDGNYDNTKIFKKAIDTCYEAGGGIIEVPEGVFLTGPIHLKDNINLFLSKNATIRFIDDPKRYLPVVFTRWEGVECYNYSPFVYSYGVNNVAITGEGTLDGNCNNKNWWYWCGKKEFGWTFGLPNQIEDRKRLFNMAEEGIPVEERVFGLGSYLRPCFIQFYKSQNILVEGIKIINSPMWCIHPVLSKNIVIKGVTIESLGPNNDGIDIESCENVLIEDSFLNNGDDCIVIKSGRNADGRRIGIPTKNILVRNCVMKDGHGGLVIGSEISGGAKDIIIEDSIMDSPHLDEALRFKTNSLRGGNIENIYAVNINVNQVKNAVLKIDYYYEEGDVGKYLPSIKNVYLKNVVSMKSSYGMWIKAYERSPVKELNLINCDFRNISFGNYIEYFEEINLADFTIKSQKLDMKARGVEIFNFY